MALSGRATTTLAACQTAILATLASEYAARVQPLATCAVFDPAALTDDDGAPRIATPAILLEIGPATHEPSFASLGGERVNAEQIEWRAYHLISTRTGGDIQLAAAEMASITRAILIDTAGGITGQRWGLADAIDRPERIRHQPVDLGLAGHACRLLMWEQTALYTDTYQ